MKVVPLSQIADFINGHAFKPSDWGDEGLKIIRIQNLNDGNKPFNRTTKEVPDKYLIQKGDLLVSWSATLGVFEWEEDENALLNQHIFKVEPKLDIIDKSYFKYVLKYSIEKMFQFTHGSTMKHIVRGDFLNHEIPLPSLEDQKKIVKILDQADALRQKRQQAIDLLDEYLKSLFLDMFGDPVTNSGKNEQIKFSQIIEDIRYGSSRKSLTDHDKDAVPILRIPNIESGLVNFNKLQYQILPDKEKDKLLLQEGDLLFVRSNGNPDYIGRCAIFQSKRECIYASYLIRVRIKENVEFEPLFVRYCFSMDSYKHKIRKESRTTAGNYNINTKGIKNFDLIKPSLDRQSEFASVFNRVGRLKDKMKSQLIEMDNQFNALMQRSFGANLF